MKATITGEGLKKPEKIKIAPELEAVQDLMPMSADDRAALRESIERDGIREPLRGYEIGMTFYVLSGFNRLAIACELNAEATEAGKEPPFPTVKTQTIETADKQAFAIDENKARRQLTLDDKRRLAAWLLKRNPAMSNNQAGKLAGIDDKTAGKVRADLEARSEIPNVAKRTDSKGRMQAARKNIDSQRKPASDHTGKAQKGATGQSRGQGKGDGDAALRAFNSALSDALKKVEMQPASVLKVAVRHAKSWLKDVERKHRAAEKAK